jgi:hypothetical protein
MAKVPAKLANQEQPSLPITADGMALAKDHPDYAIRAEQWWTANIYSQVDFLPAHYKGKPAAVFVGIQTADQMGADRMLVLQNSFVIGGKMAFMATFLIARLNASGRTAGPIEYTFDGDGDKFGCTASVIDKSTGHKVTGTKITMFMVKREGWDKNPKWTNMPEQMFRYRAAAFLIRSQYPDVALGLQTAEEAEDSLIIDGSVREPVAKSVGDITAQITGGGAAPLEIKGPVEEQPVVKEQPVVAETPEVIEEGEGTIVPLSEAEMLNRAVEQFPSLMKFRNSLQRTKNPERIYKVATQWRADSTLSEEEKMLVVRMRDFRLGAIAAANKDSTQGSLI